MTEIRLPQPSYYIVLSTLGDAWGSGGALWDGRLDGYIRGLLWWAREKA